MGNASLCDFKLTNFDDNAHFYHLPEVNNYVHAGFQNLLQNSFTIAQVFQILSESKWWSDFFSNNHNFMLETFVFQRFECGKQVPHKPT